MEPQELFDGQRNSADVIICDGLPPEESAMSQSLYSRKPKSFLFHLWQVLKKGAQTFMSKFYVEYNHDSIGDCGSTTLHFENVSMLAAKVIQHWPLYSGQEASTRYLDFTGRIMINPLVGQLRTNHLFVARKTLEEPMELLKIEKMFVSVNPEKRNETTGEKGSYIQNKWMGFYQKHMPIVQNWVKETNPIPEGATENDYVSSVKARSFDILRAFIPAGMTTLVSWHSNLRQLRDHLAIMKYHPADEISRISQTAILGLESTYPASFIKKKYEKTEEYHKLRSSETSYYDQEAGQPDFWIDDSKFSTSALESRYKNLLITRPPKTCVPNEVGDCGIINVGFNIDFGSFRDVQRHRKGVCRMPLLTTKHGFHPWYLERLPEETRREAEILFTELVPLINEIPCSDVDRQYFIPMGFIVVAEFAWTFDECVYVAELRSSETVHPTLRTHAHSLGKWIQRTVPYSSLHIDWSEDKWSFKRGKQDIKEKV